MVVKVIIALFIANQHHHMNIDPLMYSSTMCWFHSSLENSETNGASQSIWQLNNWIFYVAYEYCQPMMTTRMDRELGVVKIRLV